MNREERENTIGMAVICSVSVVCLSVALVLFLSVTLSTVIIPSKYAEAILTLSVIIGGVIVAIIATSYLGIVAVRSLTTNKETGK